jgi:hypothetical protein
MEEPGALSSSYESTEFTNLYSAPPGSHSLHVPSPEAVATQVPSGLKRQSATPPPPCARHPATHVWLWTSRT